jgi:uncharacterized protein YndB with AHSA1/START domain
MAEPVTRSIDISAPAEVIFDILSDARQHVLIDGSGTVQAMVAGPERLSAGAAFRLRLHLGMPYLMTHQVLAYEPNRLIAWGQQGRQVWHYRLEPCAAGTRVTQTYRPRLASTQVVLRLLRVGRRNAAAVPETLRRLKNVAESRG